VVMSPRFLLVDREGGMDLIVICAAGFITGAVLAYFKHKANREKEVKDAIEAKRAKWRQYAAAKRDRRKAARGR